MKSGTWMSLAVVCSVAFNALGEDRLRLLAGGSTEAVGILANEAKLREPFAAEYDEDGRLWILEMAKGNRLLRVESDGKLTHVAGKVGPRRDGDETLVDGNALEATFHGPHNLAILSPVEILIGDTWNGRVRVWDGKTLQVTSRESYFVPREKARGEGPYCIALSPNKQVLFIANLQRVYAWDLNNGQIFAVAGNGQKGVPLDGSRAVDSPLVDPRAVAMDRAGNLYILERNGHALRLVDPSGKIYTVVNRSGRKGNGLEEGNALDIGLNGPKHICIDEDDNVIIADAESNTVRRYDAKEKTIVRLAGTGKSGFGDLSLPARECTLARPHGVSIHPANGKIVIIDSYNDRVLLLEQE